MPSVDHRISGKECGAAGYVAARWYGTEASVVDCVRDESHRIEGQDCGRGDDGFGKRMHEGTSTVTSQFVLSVRNCRC